MKAIVMTTIHIPDNIREWIHKADSEWYPIIVGDLKTPHESVEKICKEVNGIYLSPTIQEKLGFKHTKSLPWNCYDRKNIGYLFALKEGAEIICSTDDDNIPYQHWDSYVKLGKQTLEVVDSNSGWWNCCSLGDVDITPRGFPYWLINNNQKPSYSFKKKKVDISIQIGLWIGDPDTDAMTRIIKYPQITKYKNKNIALAQGTKCPYNTQNTFITREMMPSQMLWCCADSPFYRYDDIFTGYGGQIIAQKHNKTIKFGRPYVNQIRNYHDNIKDLKSEIGGMEIQPKLFDILITTKLSGSPSEDMRQIIYEATSAIPQLPQNLREQADTWCEDIKSMGLG